jgi:hypothetical protein
VRRLLHSRILTKLSANEKTPAWRCDPDRGRSCKRWGVIESPTSACYRQPRRLATAQEDKEMAPYQAERRRGTRRFRALARRNWVHQIQVRKGCVAALARIHFRLRVSPTSLPIGQASVASPGLWHVRRVSNIGSCLSDTVWDRPACETTLA